MSFIDPIKIRWKLQNQFGAEIVCSGNSVVQKRRYSLSGRFYHSAFLVAHIDLSVYFWNKMKIA